MQDAINKLLVLKQFAQSRQQDALKQLYMKDYFIEQGRILAYDDMLVIFRKRIGNK